MKLELEWRLICCGVKGREGKGRWDENVSKSQGWVNERRANVGFLKLSSEFCQSNPILWKVFK